MSLTFAYHREATFKDGCLSVRKAVLDKTREGTVPGPIYDPKPRVSSTERSLRDITFGTGPARYVALYFLFLGFLNHGIINPLRLLSFWECC
mmetsp:Transcript_14244/g.21042  ORF Transcript_14244/g.21042 Transcript_14244/m.21042 type:complete len:92 (-) Transcript_14244:561-836(-)